MAGRRGPGFRKTLTTAVRQRLRRRRAGRYRAFLSYAHADRGLGERFQRAIEHYRIPKPLRGADRGFGRVPKYLTPLFRDRSDANASGDLRQSLRSALEDSDALVPLCSPRSAQSEWVNNEIRVFKSLGRRDRIIPVVLHGTPRRFEAQQAPDGAFPPALFQRVDEAGGVVAEDDPEPLAADLREAPLGDGFDLAKLKVVAALTGIPLTELTGRQLEAERRERRVVRTVAATMALLAIAAGIAAVMAFRSANEARRRLADSIEIASRRVDDGARLASVYGVRIEVARDLLAGAEEDFTLIVGDASRSAPVLELQRGRLFDLFSRSYGEIGDRPQQETRARDSLVTLAAVRVRRSLFRPWTWFADLPSAADVAGEEMNALESLALALTGAGGCSPELAATIARGKSLAEQQADRRHLARFWSLDADRHYVTGNLAASLAAYDAAIAALGTGGDAGSATDVALDDAAALSDRAKVLFEMGRHQAALDSQAEALRRFEAYEAAHQDDVVAFLSIANALGRLGYMRYAMTQDWGPSIADFERAVAMLQDALDGDPTRVDYARNLSIALERLGFARLQMGRTDLARPLFDRMQALREGRLARDPDNLEAQRDVAVALERQGDLALPGDPKKALELYERARALRPALASSGCTDLVAVRDHALLWARIGEARQASRSALSWREAFSTAIQLIGPPIDAGTAPPGWLRDLAAFRAGYGDTLRKAGQAAEAREQWTAALDAIRRQLAIQPDDPRLLKDQADLQARLTRSRR